MYFFREFKQKLCNYKAAAIYYAEYSKNKQKLVEISVMQYNALLKELFEFNKREKLINVIVFRMKLLWRNSEIHIPDFSFNKSYLN